MKIAVNKIHLIGYIIGLLCLIGLLFINRWELDFAKHIAHNPLLTTMDLTLNKLILYILNISMLIIIFSPVKDEDERVEKIRNYVSIHTFIAAIPMSVILLGLLMKANTSLLIFTGIVQAYYIVIFEICLYRDSSIVYMSNQQVMLFYKEVGKRFKFTYALIPMIVIISILIYRHQYGLFSLVIIGITYLNVLIKSIYMHWQK